MFNEYDRSEWSCIIAHDGKEIDECSFKMSGAYDRDWDKAREDGLSPASRKRYKHVHRSGSDGEDITRNNGEEGENTLKTDAKRIHRWGTRSGDTYKCFI